MPHLVHPALFDARCGALLLAEVTQRELPLANGPAAAGCGLHGGYIWCVAALSAGAGEVPDIVEAMCGAGCRWHHSGA
ncbi:hypothetical protein [Nocardia vinacea]|uniref:hypothetical protein n=1 Tax=Nocardia vinacea TaxID=96468 RepID=UPI000316BBB5|nr:hypothetical protein [Nocardia vinacea]